MRTKLVTFPMKLHFNLFIILLCVWQVQNARILGVFPMAGMSHHILASKLMKGLLAAGHDVTMVTSLHMEDVPEEGKFTEIFLDGFAQKMQEKMAGSNLFGFAQHNFLVRMALSLPMIVNTLNETLLHHPKVKDLLKSNQDFDAVILLNCFHHLDLLKVFAHIYQCPLILVSTTGVTPYVNAAVGNESPVSYAAHLLLGDASKELKFLDRVANLFSYSIDHLMANLYTFPKFEAALRHAFPDAPSIYDLQTNVSLVFLNSHPSFSPARPTVPNMIEIGGYFIDPPKKLPKDLQTFLDNSPEGAIFFSLGSNFKSKDISLEKTQVILNVLGRLKEKVLWKFEEELPGKPANVEIRSWLPQQDILAHPNTKLFITHGGFSSSTETIYHGVPVLMIPIMGDQFENADKAVNYGYGINLPYHDPAFNAENFEKALRELLDNPKYKENAQWRAKLFHDRPEPPMKTMQYWVDYVIRNKGAPHLRVGGKDLPFYKYYMVDVLAFIAVGLISFTLVRKFFVQTLVSYVRRMFKVVQKQKTN